MEKILKVSIVSLLYLMFHICCYLFFYYILNDWVSGVFSAFALSLLIGFSLPFVLVKVKNDIHVISILLCYLVVYIIPVSGCLYIILKTDKNINFLTREIIRSLRIPLSLGALTASVFSISCGFLFLYFYRKSVRKRALMKIIIEAEPVAIDQ